MGRGARAKERVTRPQCAESSESAGAVDGRRDEDWDALRHQRMGCDGVGGLDHPVGANGPGDRCRRGMKEPLAAVQRGRRAVCPRGRGADSVLPSVDERAGPLGGDRSGRGRPARVRARQPDVQHILGIVGLRDCRGTDGRGVGPVWVGCSGSTARPGRVGVVVSGQHAATDWSAIVRRPCRFCA